MLNGFDVATVRASRAITAGKLLEPGLCGSAVHSDTQRQGDFFTENALQRSRDGRLGSAGRSIRSTKKLAS